MVFHIENSEKISSGRIEDYENAKIMILEVNNNDGIIIRGSFGMNNGCVSGLFTSYDINKNNNI